MPFITTLTIMRMFRRSDNEDLPFFDPPLLRSLLDDALAGNDQETLKAAHKLVDELEALLSNYRATVVAGVDSYIEETSNRYITAPELIRSLKPLDNERMQTLLQEIELRESLFALLSDAQWEAVFGPIR